MSWDGIVVFAVAYAIVVISPGPGLASFIGQILGHGIKAAPAQALGIYAGDLVWYGLAATGLAALAHAFAGVFLIVKWLGAAYLVYLAWKMWTAEVKSLDAVAARGPISHSSLFVSSLMVTLSNPKAIVFYLAVLPAIVDLSALTMPGFAVGAAIIAVILFAILGAYGFAAHAARCFFRSPKAMRILNRVSGTAIAGAAVVIAARS
jgi:threonine/homoserine/homoserine lactone efflux protein